MTRFILKLIIASFFIYSGNNIFSLAQDIVDINSSEYENKITPQEEIPLLFASEEILNLTITANLRAIRRDIGEIPSYHPATISYYTPDSNLITLDLKIRARGHFRKSKCEFPPLKLNFVKKSTKNTVFNTQDKIKLVTHCMNDRKSYEQWLLEEYMIYKIYNFFTDYSFRARLALITYRDSAGREDDFTEYGFFIENANVMANRNGGTITKIKNLPPTRCNYDLMTLFCIFQYLIGNTDWGVRALHNIKLVILDDPLFPGPVPVPYDFDFSGIINTPYAGPDPILPISDVSERLWRCSCRSPEEIAPILESFNNHREEIYSMYENLEPLEEGYKNRSLRYIDQFYEIINNTKKIKRNILKGCKTQ